MLLHIYLNTKQIHLSKIVIIGSIIVNDPVHANEPGLDCRAFAFGYGGGLRLFTVTPPSLLVQVHLLDPYKHFRPFLLAPVHVLDLYEHFMPI